MSYDLELPWTGERLVPSVTGDTAVEHLHRYAFARDYVRGKDVLDIACGEGYGSHLLSSVAANVIGVDISLDAIAHAHRKYGGDHVKFTVGSCTAIPLSNSSVDAVVSFETLEHLAEHEQMLREVKRVLRSDGILLLSSPDKLQYTDIPEYHNPFHVRELYKDEFKNLLSAFFAYVYMFEQRICHASVLAPTSDLPIAGLRHYQGDFCRLTHTDGIRAPLYILAVATDADLELLHNASLFQGRNIPTEQEKQLAEARTAHAAAVAELEKQLAEAKLAHAVAVAELEKKLTGARTAHAAAAAELEKQLAEARTAHAAAAAELEKQLAEARTAHAAAAAELEKQLAETRTAHAAAAAELGKQLAEVRTAHAAAAAELGKQLAEASTANAAVAGELADMRRRFARLQRPPLNARVLALGIVTYNNQATQLERLVRSIELASERLDQDQYITRLYSIDCGGQSEWAEIGIVHQCVVSDGNLGFGQGMNRLMAKAFADTQVSWFLCINPDGMLHRDLLAEVLRCAEQYRDSLIEARQFPEEHPKPYDPYSGLTLWASGACMLIPRRVYEVIGGFDENIFMYMEDVDLSWRARSAGFTVRVAPRALFAHSVLDRKPDPLIEKSYYLSHRYLAYKWRRPTEQAFYERILLEQGYLATLPPLPPLDPVKTPMDTTPAVFEYGAAYAPLRWSPSVSCLPGDAATGTEHLLPCCVTTECSLIGQPGTADNVLSVIVLFDHPFDTVSLDELLFDLAVQDCKNLDIMVMLPDAGPELHRCVENAVLAQPWPLQTRLRVTSVGTRASRTISPHLVNAGLRQATGRYLALIHHQDLVYQHAYRMLIERLNGAAIAFGGVRLATHSHGHRHWMVTGKEQAEADVTAIHVAADGRRTIHAFVADREQLDPDYLTVHQPTSPMATAAFLKRLAGHPKADFSLAGVRMVERRIPPQHSAAELNLGQLPSAEMVKIQTDVPPAKQRMSFHTKHDYKAIPIFINGRDLFVPLRQLVIWLLEAGYTRINVIDNDSSYPALLEFYNTMRKDIRVIRLGMNVGHTSIWDTKILDQLGIAGPYVWTDPDIVPTKECPANVLEFFWAALQAYPNRTKVGFGLRIDDLPDHYRFKREVIVWEGQYWEKKISPKLYDAPIDTTFALYRAGSGYKPIDAAFRTGFPYLARHVPWYENLDRPSDDLVYYSKNAKPGINSWSGDALPSYLHNWIKQRLNGTFVPRFW